MRTIWKFELETIDRQTVDLPKCAEILTVQTQRERPCLWAMVNPGADKEPRKFEIYGTGHIVPYDLVEDRKYIGTFQLQEGDLVFHLFECL